MGKLDQHSLETGVGWMRAAGEPTRLRLLALLDKAELTVSDLVDILGQSQPRVSRHLKLLVEAGLARRFQEGAWAYFRTQDEGSARTFLDTILLPLASEDKTLSADNSRLEKVRRQRAAKAASYFAANADQWNKIRSLHVAEQEVEKNMLEMGLATKPRSLLDLGTGTGRILQLFAPHISRGLGIDTSSDMLTLARTEISAPEYGHLQVRQGNVYDFDAGQTFDLVVLHQVLHFLEEPALALTRAAECLNPSGRILIVDFAPHDFEFLREEHAHHWLGVSDELMKRWMSEAGLRVSNSRRLAPLETSEAALSVVLWLVEKG